jgi:basic amino acid/polyamine antiporter, APA family
MAVLVGSTIGSGIFRVPAGVAERLQDPGPVMLAWVLGGAIALFGALTLAELAAAMPRSGGVFAYLLEGFGPLPAFLFGWSELTVIRASALGAIATIFAEYLGYFLALTPAGVRYVAAGAIVVMGLLNYVGVQSAARFMNFITVLKYGALAGLVLLAFTGGNGSAAHFTPAWSGGLQISLLATALISIMWTYDGWADLSFMGGEVKDPGRTLPLALILGTAGIVVVYLLLNLAYIYLVPLPEMAASPLIAATAADRIRVFAGAGGAVVSGVVMVSCLGALTGSMMTGPRIFFAMADRGLFFRAIARVSPRYQSPSVAIWLAVVLGVVYVLFNNFQQLADKFILGIWPFYALAVAAVFVLRRTRPDLPRPYRTWGYPVVPLLFLAASVGMVVNALVTDPVNTGITFGIILAGVPVFLVWRARGGLLVRGTAALGLCAALVGCAGETRFDPGAADISGDWDTLVENIRTVTGAEPIVCSAAWSMSIVASPDPVADSPYQATLSPDALYSCSNGYSAPLQHRGLSLAVTREGARVAFIAATSRDTFARADLVERGLMLGTTGEKFYAGGELTARR